jgi:hypothetical protein
MTGDCRIVQIIDPVVACNELLEVAFAEKLKISNFKVVTLIFAGKSREKRSIPCT